MMKSSKGKSQSVEEYLANFPPRIRKRLKELRKTIKTAAPQSEEVISYQMPTYKLEGNLVHFAAFKNHIGFYPAPSGIRAFKKELAPYETSKGAVRFPTEKAIPLTLVKKIVKFRVKENLDKRRS